MKYFVVVAIICTLMSVVLSTPQDEPVPGGAAPGGAAPGGAAPGPGTPGEDGDESRFFFGSHNLHIGNSDGGYPNQGGYPAPGGYPVPGGYPYPSGGMPLGYGHPFPGFPWGK